MSASIEKAVHGGRGLTEWTDPQTDEAEAGWPEMAYESIRAINHLTFGHAVPAPVLYDVLGNLKGVGHLLPQALTQLADGLQRSLDEFQVYDREGDPSTNVVRAREHLAAAVEAARALGAELEAAQSAIAGQGYQDPAPPA